MQIETTLRALADPTRLRIMRLLSAMELAVGELALALGQSQPRVSRHVAILCEAGLAERRPEGAWVFLRQAVAEHGDRSIGREAARLLAVAEASDKAFAAACAEDRARLAAVRDSRERAAAEYFARHAAEWDELRAMLTPADTVEAALLDALADEPPGQMLDIGTGTGRIAELLADAAEKVVGLDKSPEMLRAARVRLQDRRADKVELIQGDFTALPFAAEAFDTVVLHQVLHYAQQPDYAIAEAARVCRAGGRIAIVDLAAHDREELRRVHAHARLGFGERRMGDMLRRHGIALEHTARLEGGELPVIVWTGRKAPSTVTPLTPARDSDRAATPSDKVLER